VRIIAAAPIIGNTRNMGSLLRTNPRASESLTPHVAQVTEFRHPFQ
jgi:hypothetical protein